MKKKIALLCCGWAADFILEFIEGMKTVLSPNSTDIYVFNCYNYQEFSGYPNFTGYSIYSLIHYEDFDGVIILADLIGNPRILEKERLRILQSGTPSVTISHELLGMSCIKMDNYSGAFEVIEHLIKEHGCKNLAHVSGKENAIDIAERYKAFRVALSANNLQLDMNQVYTLPTSSYTNGYHFGKKVFTSGNVLPDAFVCANDSLALGMIRAAAECGINIPNQVKIVGYDDLILSRCSEPAVTTVKSNADVLGAEAAKYVLAGNHQPETIKIESKAVFRSSCGCESEYSATETSRNFIHLIAETKEKNEFTQQIQIMDDVFTEAADVFTLLTNLEIFFARQHSFEGSDFCIFLKSDWTSVLINSAENLPLNLSYGQGVQSIVSIQGGEKYPREIINTRDLIPGKMHSTENNVYLFMPIYNHSYVHGYFVTRNNLTLVKNCYGYTWSRNFGNSIERFRKRTMYKQMSQQFLRLSTKDGLSGLLNRVGLEKLAKPYYAQNKKNGLTTVLFFVDINKMKHINDAFGHLHGDLAVKTIAAAVMEVIPKNWLPIRYGGDEFLVVGNSKNYNGEDYCSIITERIKAKTSIMRLPYELSASVGTLTVPASSPLTLEEAVEKVDDIMYKAKQEFHKNDSTETK
ncbi:MAG: GGDEF domain-containing protein [Treponema sp.]|nr:GGDEF domain-containing protein [Treponema sp.]